MIESNRLNELVSRFPEDVQVIFKDMIQAYQWGYVDYVYQAESISVQNRRIKNMVKNFRKMDYFYIMPLTQELALEIATKWLYPAPYDVYQASSNPYRCAELLSQEARGDRYFAVIRNGALMGYFILNQMEKAVELEVQMKPWLMGKGHGKAFYTAIEDYLKETSLESVICLRIEPFNQRALSLFSKQGYQKQEELQEGRMLLVKELTR